MTCLENQPWTPFAAELSHFDPQWLALHNRLHRLRQSWTGQCAGLAMTVQWSGAGSPVEAGIEVALTLGDTPLNVCLPSEALELLGFTSRDLTGLPGAMLLELALLSVIEPVEQLAGLPLRVRDNPAAHAQPLVVSLTMQVQLAQGAPLHVALQLSAAAATLLADLLEQHATPAAHPLPALQLPFTVENGEAELSLAELRSLNPGDVVMLDHWPDRQARLVLQGRRLHARAELDGNTLKLLEQPIALNFLKEHHMTGSAESATPQSLDSPLDDLPLKLVCQVGSVELSLAQLRELGTGSLVQLTPQLHDGVDLMVNGRRVGQGQLVKIGDGLGVRLLSFATP
jgi:type III secretion protein Q